MKEIVTISIVALMMVFGGFAQTDSVVYTDRYECLADVYQFKKEFIENVSYTEDFNVILSPAFIQKHDFTWEQYDSIDTKCSDLNQDTEKPACIFEQMILELSDDYELVRRVITMKPRPGCGEITPKTNEE